MWNGVILTLYFLLILVFLGIILTSITSMLFVATFFTPSVIVKELLLIIAPKDDDRVIDLGSGDGRVLLALSDTAKIKGYGYDISPIMVIIAKLRKLLTFRFNREIIFDVASIFDIKYNQYDIIYCNLNSRVLRNLAPKFTLQLKGTRVFSYMHEIPNKKPFKKHTLSNNQTLFEYRY